MHEKYLYSEFFWSVFSRFRTENGEILLIQSECGKYGPAKPNTDTFQAVNDFDFYNILRLLSKRSSGIVQSIYLFELTIIKKILILSLLILAEI